MNREAEQKAPTAVGSGALLGGRELVIIHALTCGITQSHVALQRLLVTHNNRFPGTQKWFRVELATTKRANMRMVVKPTKGLIKLLDTLEALCSDKGGIKRTAYSKRVLNILRCDFHKNAANPPNEKS